MESNKFATMLLRRSRRITFVLVYAFLEWALIFLLLLNALFSYLIIKFAHYFGLKPPCLLCSRIDHLFEPQSSESSYRNLICEQHGIELSKSGYCFNHRKLVESQDMCGDCSSSHPDVWSPISVSQWLKEVRTVKSDEVNLRCSCCGVSINSKALSSHAVIKPCLGVLEDTQKGNLVSSDGHVDDVHSDGEPGGNTMGLLDIKSGEDDEIQISKDVQVANLENNLEGFSFCLPKGVVRPTAEARLNEDFVLEEKREPLPKGSSISIRDPYANEKILPQQHLDFYIDCDDLIPVGFINRRVEKMAGLEKSLELWRETDDELVFEPDMAVAPAGVTAKENLNSSFLDLLISDDPKAEDMPNKHDQELEMIEVERNMKLNEFKHEDLPTKQEQGEELKEELNATENSEETTIKDLVTEQSQAEETKKDVVLESDGDQAPGAPLSASDVQETEDMEVTQLDVKIPRNDAEFACHKKCDQIHAVCCGEMVDEIQLLEPSSSCKEEGPTPGVLCEASTSLSGLQENGDIESKQTNEEREGLRDVSVEITEPELKSCVTTSHDPNENHEIEEDRVSETRTSVDSLQYLQRKVVLLGTRESMHEESLHGSIINEIRVDGGDFNIEDLKSEFRALYAELEEERNASATAAHHTMAMINRLHEEKAAIEMEALQYQRIMEEQADYDQESLQLMNEVLAKMESEKQELETELEVCRKKIMEYEERERARLMNQKNERSCTKSRTSSASCSNGEEGDETEQYSLCRCETNGHHDTRADVVLSLKESLSCFEEERLSILQQLKVLEEKLCNLVEEEEQNNGSVKPFEQLNQYNAEELCASFKLYGDTNGLENGSSDMNGEHHQDGAVLEIDNKLYNGIADRLDPFLLDELPLNRFDLEKRRFTIEEEVEHVYERLQALEADRAFVKHCVGSLSKGDRGIDLLQEILQHFRDLKNIEIQTRNLDGMC